MINLLFYFMLFLHTSIYDIHFNTADGVDTSFSAFQGKKILIVNIATGSGRADELDKLQQLYEQYQDSLVVVAFPSNSFGNEARSNTEIKEFCQSTYHTTFIIAEKANVTGSSVQPLYSWLFDPVANGVLNGSVAGDFHKFLIDGNGELMGVYSAEVDPLSPSIVNAITGN